MKRLITILVVLISIVSISFASTDTTIKTEDIIILDFAGNNKELLETQAIAHQMAECARALGYDEEHNIIKTAQREWWFAQDQIEINNQLYEDWINKFNEYPYATYVWLYLTEELGYNNYVAAGILGNMMAEVGGGTLNLDYQLYDSTKIYYGICQWSKKYYPEVRGCSLEEQCDFLAQTIEYEINTFGYKFAKGYKYSNFIALKDIEDAALMFAKAYERCADWTYQRRVNYAYTAYDYFTR